VSEQYSCFGILARFEHGTYVFLGWDAHHNAFHLPLNFRQLTGIPFPGVVIADVATSTEPVYTQKSLSRDGIGKVYLGREISQVMGHRGAVVRKYKTRTFKPLYDSATQQRRAPIRALCWSGNTFLPLNLPSSDGVRLG